MIAIQIDTTQIADFRDFAIQFPNIAPRALSLAINDTMRDVVLPRGRELMNQQVNFPPGYLDRPDRFRVSMFSSPTALVGQVSARDDPTSLRQFAKYAGVPPSQRGDPWTPVESVMVHPGRAKPEGRMYIVPLRRAEAWGNVGLAIRLRPGERVENIREYKPIEIYKNVFLLYGPSVNQVFQSVAVDLMPEVTSYMTQEFYRQMDRLLGGVNFGIT